MKRIGSILFVLVFIISSLAGCSGGGSTTSSTDDIAEELPAGTPDATENDAGIAGLPQELSYSYMDYVGVYLNATSDISHYIGYPKLEELPHGDQFSSFSDILFISHLDTKDAYACMENEDEALAWILEEEGTYDATYKKDGTHYELSYSKDLPESDWQNHVKFSADYNPGLDSAFMQLELKPGEREHTNSGNSQAEYIKTDGGYAFQYTEDMWDEREYEMAKQYMGDGMTLEEYYEDETHYLIFRLLIQGDDAIISVEMSDGLPAPIYTGQLLADTGWVKTQDAEMWLESFSDEIILYYDGAEEHRIDKE